ncbi:SMC-Scp complex subunit ScpB [Candidatus Woesearchaeota archaeon]|jgi:segregation and condensation protein B|nr:SMC-Scp complex subunit ScpB [Candidatus Woesearchaeota archaeon]MBT4110410.1 SMC-Scp complex subunit ScpB [Candidatus Woesearchaeota archaeon]MBT4336066.1 SMC-Scp complex subunit ScpB [Candidatus Woesearchaeota archaeon]MBT4468955.1 SMC-Scp complex subunit ScpB [Candidatus Woesearchaeota archaeon]MBT6744726.1 SMC-Scp complex subunit ScpB [Candidatus Woesearchaeota archaeon]
MTNQKKVEAVLFAVGKEITSERIANLCSLEIKEVNKVMKALTKDYEQSDNALKIEARDNGWKLTVQDKYVPLVSNLVSSLELEKPLMDTLAVVAWKYPIVQSEIIKLRGSGAYDHMRELVEMGFIAKEKFGRTYKVKLSQKFFSYFDLPSEEAKQAFLKEVPAEVLEEAGAVEKEAEEVERLVELEGKEKAGKDEIGSAMDELQK